MLTEDQGQSLIGRQIGAYKILALLGAGGMGEVYRARDTKLGRDVAFKVLPALFASDPDRLRRFEQEARLLAALSHPNIAIIHGLEEAHASPGSGQTAVKGFILELVEGLTLAELLAQQSTVAGRQLVPSPGLRPPSPPAGERVAVRAKALPLADALPIARQIADGLEAAHEKGIVHRDLKPANIKITPDGIVKVLDFGLATVYAGEGAGPDLSQLPTVTDGGTREATILGTPAYMSPEQARGKAVDKRTDIWAFGCVLYEMLTGRTAFAGETVSDTIAKILEREPDWGALPGATPISLRRLLQRCLEKDPKRRLRDIGDARVELDEGVSAPGTVKVAPSPSAHRQLGRLSLVLGSAGAGALAALSVFLMLRPASTPTRLLTRFATGLAPSEELAPGTAAPAVALSPDGTRFAYTARRGGERQLYLRSIDSLEGRAVPGTEGAHGGPFFSPDGQWVGFFAAGKLKKVAVAGGEPVALADVAAGCGASWATNDTIVFSPFQFLGVMQVSSSGGAPRMLTTLDPKQADI